MPAKKKKGECPKPKERTTRSKCSYCINGYIQIGSANDKAVTMECGYCLGTGSRSIP